MVACYRGFQSVVALLSRCPFLDVNQQDKEGDTALMLAAQAGHVSLVSHLINYYAGLDLERRDQRGLTALMKAAMRDRSECVAALLMAGADLTAVDPVRGKTALEWAFLTDSFDTVQRIRQLLRRPQVEQLSRHYQPEWPALPGLVAQAQAAPSLLERLQATLTLPFVQSPQEGGVLDHLVTITTSLASPFLTTACHTLYGDCSHEIKRHLLLVRKVMTNLDSILKSRDITLPTKVHLVKAVVFPVVMYGCESWTVKKAERQRIDAFEL
uniref:Ankyrin repeat domain 33 n=1 Tax=Capra hircus TaxID=9925 RepID=A0A452EVH2_CAPHI